jgi:hypothetical protein
MLAGGDTWDNATLRGLSDSAPDCEGSMISSQVDGKTCFFVSAPWSDRRQNLTVQSSCGPSAPDVWSKGHIVDHGDSSYSSLAMMPSGKLMDLCVQNFLKSLEVCVRRSWFAFNVHGRRYMCSGGIGIAEVPL